MKHRKKPRPRGSSIIAGTKAPSFEGLFPASPASSKAKRRNRANATTHERLLRSHLWALGLRYRKNVTSIIGKPDIVFSSARTVVFCDGDFWHGRGWPALRSKLSKGANASYWVAKIQANVRRDAANAAALKRQGWNVIRIWEGDILQDPRAVARRLKRAILSLTDN